MSNIKYERETAVLKTSTKTLCAECYLTKPTKEELYGSSTRKSSLSPMFLNSNMSRFVITLIDITKKDKSGKNEYLVANLPYREIDFIYEKTKALSVEEMLRPITSSESSESGDVESKVYSLSMVGKYKGKTAAEMFNVCKINDADLKKHLEWLKENAAVYTKNNEQIAVVKEAARMNQAGTLNGSKGNGGTRKVIYESGIKYFPSKKIGEFYMCYELNISYFNGKVYIEVKNSLAPLVRKDNGSTTIAISKKTKSQMNSFSADLNDWKNFIQNINSVNQNFQNFVFPEMWKLMMDNVYKPSV